MVSVFLLTHTYFFPSSPPTCPLPPPHLFTPSPPPPPPYLSIAIPHRRWRTCALPWKTSNAFPRLLLKATPGPVQVSLMRSECSRPQYTTDCLARHSLFPWWGQGPARKPSGSSTSVVFPLSLFLKCQICPVAFFDTLHLCTTVRTYPSVEGRGPEQQSDPLHPEYPSSAAPEEAGVPQMPSVLLHSGFHFGPCRSRAVSQRPCGNYERPGLGHFAQGKKTQPHTLGMRHPAALPHRSRPGFLSE